MAITLLVPVRNAAADLQGFLESAERITDRVIALDDGSTDDSAQILEASPLVELVIRNPRRETYAGWDDAANRQRLLDAAIEAGGGWVLFLDADERVDEDDAQALREFVERDAVAGLAYGLQMFRAWGERVAPDPVYAYRLFAAAPGQALPGRRLHFNPVPEGIGRGSWVRTTFRVRHLEGDERLAERRRKYEEAEPGAQPGLAGRTPVEAPDRLVAWEPRPPGIAALAVGPEGERAAIPAHRAQPITCLLPARNCAGDIPAFLDSAARFADAVIALDDGSTDNTPELLEASPLVTRLLRNPRRETYAGWDDAANRQRLLDAAIEAGAGWVLFLDADERIDADDAEALREFAARAADPSAAYGFRVFRMIGDDEHFDRSELWVYRLFQPSPGQRLPERRLHLVPVPTAIPRERWRKTTIRIKHLSSLTSLRRDARLRKYEQADPSNRWQRSYAALVEVGRPREWVPRPAGLPALADPLERGPAGELDLGTLDPGAPLLSAVVIARDNAATIEASVRSVVEQRCPASFEVILAASGTDGTADVVRERFPEVRVVDVPEPGLPGAARNAGLAAARGEIVSFPGSHVELPQGSLAARIRAHEQGFSMVTGSVLNGTDTPAGWAAYFLDHSASLPAGVEEELEAVPAHCSYTREALLEVGGFPEDMRAGEDTVVNGELWARGHRALRAPDIVLTHRNRSTTPWRLVRHHFTRGRALGTILASRSSTGATRRSRLAYLRGYPRWRLGETDRRLEGADDELRSRYRRVRSLARLGIIAATAGAMLESLLRPVQGALVEGVAEGRGPLAAGDRGEVKRGVVERDEGVHAVRGIHL